MKSPIIKPISERVQEFGVKCIFYSTPGLGKTPILTTAPNGLFLALEKGLRSVARSPMPSVEPLNVAELEDFFKWWFTSNEAKAYDSLCIDSWSQLAEMYLATAKGMGSNAGNKAHGQVAYGTMADKTLEKFYLLMAQKNKHIFGTAKQMLDETIQRPYFEGKVLPVRIPHEIDEIYHVERTRNVPGVSEEVVAFRTQGDIMTMARSRHGGLNEFEYPDLTQIVKKLMTV